MIRKVDSGHFFGLVETYMLEIFSMIWSMDMDRWHGTMESGIRGNGNMVFKME